MNRTLLILVLAIPVFSSCSKNLEDRITGKWKLNSTYRRVFLGRDYFETGYSSGVFTFNENGTASYISNTDTLNGQWSADRYTRGGYNSNGDWDNQSYKYLRIYMANFQRNKFIDWEFDDFHFRNSWDCIRATQFSLSSDRVYEFVRD